MFIGILLSFNHRQGYCCDEVAFLGLDRSLVLWRFQATGLTVGGRWVLQRWLSCSIDLSRTFFHVSIYLSIYLFMFVCALHSYKLFCIQWAQPQMQEEVLLLWPSWISWDAIIRDHQIHSGRSKDTICINLWFLRFVFFKKEQLWME